jgi:DeoR/GlpR family transcriptional regulator of sugar metabolism
MSPRVKGQPSAESRQNDILRRVYAAGHVSVSALSAELNVSPMTVRRDLRTLADQNLVSVVHGGATIQDDRTQGLAFSARATREAAAKRRIGKAAVADIGIDAVIGIDAGTTALEIAMQLPEDFRGTVISHSVPVLSTMLTRPAIQTVGLGGDLLFRSRCMLSGASVELAESLRLNHLFMGASAINADGVYVHSTLELDMKRAMMRAAERVTLVCDRSKVGTAGAVRVDDLSCLHTLITDGPALDDGLAAALHNADIRVVLA